MKKRVLVAMSGGVDSSVAAFLLKENGYEVAGITLRLCEGISGMSCSDDNAIDEAKKVAESMGIPHFVDDFSDDFNSEVVDKFVQSYLHGATPNPCIDCNRDVKFKRTLQIAEELGYDYISTGHYVRVRRNENTGRTLLLKGLDITKDQSYVLYSLGQNQLSRILFPLGELTKETVRAIAVENGLANAQRRDSQDICFIPDGDYVSFIENYLGQKSVPGDFVDLDGNVLGRHKGVISYTSGQRRGLGVSAERPLYVIKKDLENNTVILGGDDDLYTTKLIADNVNFISIDGLCEPLHVEAKVRYSQKTSPATISLTEQGRVAVEFEAPQRAITPGQAVVFYDGDILIGGGTIIEN